MAEQDHEEPSDLVSFGPTVDDSPTFTVGLWGLEILFFAVLVAGLTLFRGISDQVNVLVACAGMGWFVAVTAIVLRGRLQPIPGAGRRVLAVIAVAAFAVWLVAIVWASTAGRLAFGGVAILAGAGVLLETAALVAAYRARMFRWIRR